MNKSCEHYVQWIKERLAGELSGSCEEELQAHLEECPSCRMTCDELTLTLGRLREWTDVPPPRHFLVYEEPRLSPYQLLRRLAPAWRWAAAASVLLMIAGAALILMQVRVSVGGGALVVAFGKAPALQPAAVPQQLLDRFRQVIVEENQKSSAGIRAEMVAALTNLIEEDRGEQAVSSRLLEQRLLAAVESRSQQLERSMEVTVGQAMTAVLAEHRGDMSRVERSLIRFADFGEYQATQASAIMTTLNELALSQASPKGVR